MITQYPVHRRRVRAFVSQPLLLVGVNCVERMNELFPSWQQPQLFTSSSLTTYADMVNQSYEESSIHNLICAQVGFARLAGFTWHE